MSRYTVTLNYDVTVSKVIEVEADTPEAAHEAAVDEAISGEHEDHYTIQADAPNSWHADAMPNDCPECERSFGPHYTGKCDHA